jgi:hypothetical protein
VGVDQSKCACDSGSLRAPGVSGRRVLDSTGGRSRQGTASFNFGNEKKGTGSAQTSHVLDCSGCNCFRTVCACIGSNDVDRGGMRKSKLWRRRRLLHRRHAHRRHAHHIRRQSGHHVHIERDPGLPRVVLCANACCWRRWRSHGWRRSCWRLLHNRRCPNLRAWCELYCVVRFYGGHGWDWSQWSGSEWIKQRN